MALKGAAWRGIWCLAEEGGPVLCSLLTLTVHTHTDSATPPHGPQPPRTHGNSSSRPPPCSTALHSPLNGCHLVALPLKAAC